MWATATESVLEDWRVRQPPTAVSSPNRSRGLRQRFWIEDLRDLLLGQQALFSHEFHDGLAGFDRFLGDFASLCVAEDAIQCRGNLRRALGILPAALFVG